MDYYFTIIIKYYFRRFHISTVAYHQAQGKYMTKQKNIYTYRSNTLLHAMLNNSNSS